MMKQLAAGGAFICSVILFSFPLASTLLSSLATAKDADGSAAFAGSGPQAEAAEAHAGPWFSRFSELTREYLPPFLQLWDMQVPPEDLPECLQFPSLKQLSEDAAVVRPTLQRLKQRTFFRIFKLGLLSDSCADPRLSDLLGDHAGKCTEPQRCGLCECSDDEIPRNWLQKPDEEFVDRRHAASFTRWTQDRSSRQPDDPFSMFKAPKRDEEGSSSALGSSSKNGKGGIYVDLLLNPPCFTKYEGGVVWHLLYDQLPLSTNSTRTHADDTIDPFPDDLNAVDGNPDYSCSSNANLRRLVSGMQANIAALAAENFNTIDNSPPPRPVSGWGMPLPPEPRVGSNGAPAPPVFDSNLDFFRERLATQPSRVQNLYFTFGVLLKAVCRLSDVLQECSCETGNSQEDLSARADLLHVLNVTTSSLHACSSDFMQKPLLDGSRLEFLESMKGIDGLLRCVPCEKCRLHGKIKLTALHIAAKMISSSEGVPSLERNQVTALVNALYYFADSIRVVEHMQDRIYLHNICSYAVYFSVFVLLLLFLLYIALNIGLLGRQKRKRRHLTSKKRM